MKVEVLNLFSALLFSPLLSFTLVHSYCDQSSCILAGLVV